MAKDKCTKGYGLSNRFTSRPGKNEALAMDDIQSLEQNFNMKFDSATPAMKDFANRQISWRKYFNRLRGLPAESEIDYDKLAEEQTYG